jgi:hypothetical protein
VVIKKQGHTSNGCISEYIPIYAHQGLKLLKLGLECATSNMTFMIGQNMTTNQT